MSRPRLQAQRGACVMSRGLEGGRQGRASESTDRDGERDRDGNGVGVGDGNSDRSTCDVEMHKKLIDRFGGHCRQRGSESGCECAWLGEGSGGEEASCRG